jgi:hypothetical protein
VPPDFCLIVVNLPRDVPIGKPEVKLSCAVPAAHAHYNRRNNGFSAPRPLSRLAIERWERRAVPGTRVLGYSGMQCLRSWGPPAPAILRVLPNVQPLNQTSPAAQVPPCEAEAPILSRLAKVSGSIPAGKDTLRITWVGTCWISWCDFYLGWQNCGAWFDKLTMRELGGLQSPASLMVSLSNHAPRVTNPHKPPGMSRCNIKRPWRVASFAICPYKPPVHCSASAGG